MPPARSVALLIHGPNAACSRRSTALSWLARGLWDAGVCSLRRFLIAKTKIWAFFATFLRLGTLFRLCKTEAGYRAVSHLRFCAADLRLDALKQSPIAKKLQPRPVFVFVPLGWARGGAGLAHAALVTHGKESNAMGGAGLVLSVEWRVSHFLPLLPPKRANGAVFAQNRRFDVAIYGEDVDERKVDGKNPPPSPTVYKTDT